jgi:hypothetical protein
MKTIYLSGAVLVCALINVANAQSNNWPPTNFVEARAYLYNLPGKHGAPILRHGQINPSAWNRQGVVLNQSEIAAVQKAVSEYRAAGMVMGSCYKPRHAVVFYDAQRKPVGFVEVCFSCSNYRLWPDHPGPIDLDGLAATFSRLKLPVLENEKDYVSLKKPPADR